MNTKELEVLNGAIDITEKYLALIKALEPLITAYDTPTGDVRALQYQAHITSETIPKIKQIIGE